MAAVIGRALCKPCELCGKGCNECCKACESACSGLFSCIDRTFKRPFSCCLAFTILLCAIPAVVAVIFAISKFDNDCSRPLHVWLLLTAVNFLGHVAMGFYMFVRFSAPYDTSKPNDRDFIARLSHMACEDCGVALYIIFLVWVLVWQVMGGIYLGDVNSSDSSEICDDTLESVSAAALVIMWCFLGIGSLFFCLDWIAKICQYRLCAGSVDCCCIQCCCPCCVPHESRRRQHRHHQQSIGQPAHTHVAVAQPASGYPVPAQHHQQPYFPQQQAPPQQQPFPTAHHPAAQPPAPSAPPAYGASAAASAPYPYPAQQPPQAHPQAQQPTTGEPQTMAEQVGSAVGSGMTRISNFFKRS